MDKVVVTGGAGFIGSNLIDSMILKNICKKIVVIDNFSTGNIKNMKSFIDNPCVDLVSEDMTNITLIRDALKGAEIIFHLGALPSVPRSIKSPISSHYNGSHATFLLLDEARNAGVKKFIYSSSSSVYGNTDPSIAKIETMPLSPLSPYAAEKASGEYFCKVFSNIFNIETVCLRYFNVFGPRQNPLGGYAAVIPRFITKINKKEKPIIYGDGRQSRDFTFVQNVVNANILSAITKNELRGESINIAGGGNICLNDLISIINENNNYNIQAVYEEEREGDIKHSWANIDKAKNLIGYYPEISFKDGLNKTIEWYRNNE